MNLLNPNDRDVQLRAVENRWREHGFFWNFSAEVEFSFVDRRFGEASSGERREHQQQCLEELEEIAALPVSRRPDGWNDAFIENTRLSLLAGGWMEIMMFRVHRELGDVIEPKDGLHYLDGSQVEVQLRHITPEGGLQSADECRERYGEVWRRIGEIARRHGFDVSARGYHLDASLWRQGADGNWKNLTQIASNPQQTERYCPELDVGYLPAGLLPETDPEALALTEHMFRGIVRAYDEGRHVLDALDYHASEKRDTVKVAVQPGRGSTFRLGKTHFESRRGTQSGFNEEVLEAEMLLIMGGAEQGVIDPALGPDMKAGFERRFSWKVKDSLPERQAIKVDYWRDIMDAVKLNDGGFIQPTNRIANYARTIFHAAFKRVGEAWEVERFCQYVEAAIQGVQIDGAGQWHIRNVVDDQWETIDNIRLQDAFAGLMHNVEAVAPYDTLRIEGPRRDLQLEEATRTRESVTRNAPTLNRLFGREMMAHTATAIEERYRSERMLERLGVEIPRGSEKNWQASRAGISYSLGRW